MSRKLDESTRKAIESMNHLPQREIARRLDVSLGVVNGVLAKARGRKPVSKVATASPTVPPVSPAPPAPAAPHDARSALIRAFEGAPDDVAAAKRLLDLVAFDEPEIGTALAAGATTLDALAASSHGDALHCLRDPRDFANLAVRVTEDPAPFGYEREDGETEEAFDRGIAEIREAGRLRAVALLEAALEIVRRANSKGAA